MSRLPVGRLTCGLVWFQILFERGGITKKTQSVLQHEMVATLKEQLFSGQLLFIVFWELANENCSKNFISTFIPALNVTMREFTGYYQAKMLNEGELDILIFLIKFLLVKESESCVFHFLSNNLHLWMFLLLGSEFWDAAKTIKFLQENEYFLQGGEQVGSDSFPLVEILTPYRDLLLFFMFFLRNGPRHWKK